MGTSTGKHPQKSAVNDHYDHDIIWQTLFTVRVVAFISCITSFYTDLAVTEA